MKNMIKKPGKKAKRVSIPVPKVTEVELRKRREEEQALAEKKAAEANKPSVTEEEYARLVLVSNTNQDDSIIKASTLDEAIAQMSIDKNLPLDKDPEKRLKAYFKAFEEAELPILKQEKPRLTYTQYKDMI